MFQIITPMFICEMCYTPFKGWGKSKPNRFCSRSCNFVAQKGTCRDDRATPHKRHIEVRIKDADGNSKRIKEHRLLVEKAIRPLKPGEIVHHVNEVKGDNDLRNLEILSGQAAHLHRHNYWRHKRPGNKTEEQIAEDFQEFGW